MRRLWLFLLCLLTLALPSYGLARLPLTPPCPMQALPQSAMAEAGKHDCCADAASAQAEKACKPGQDCSNGSALQPDAVAALPLLAATPVHPLTASDLIPHAPPQGVWRPPRSL